MRRMQPGGDADPVPRIDGQRHRNDLAEFAFGEGRRRPGVDLVGHMIAVDEIGHLFGQRQRGLLLLGVQIGGLSLVRFEVTTVRNRQVRSLGWPAGIAISAVTACAVTVWFADHLGSPGGFRLDVSQFSSIANEFYGARGSGLLIAGGLAIRAAVLLALVWAAAQVIGRLGRGGATGGGTAGVAGIAAVLVVAFCRDWGGVADKVGHAGQLLLLVMYVLVAESLSRVSGDNTIAWWIRIYVPALLAAAVLLPLPYFNFAAFVVWPVAVTAVVVFLAAVAASVLARRPG
jgi:hypothetical protein